MGVTFFLLRVHDKFSAENPQKKNVWWTARCGDSREAESEEWRENKKRNKIAPFFCEERLRSYFFCSQHFEELQREEIQYWKLGQSSFFMPQIRFWYSLLFHPFLNHHSTPFRRLERKIYSFSRTRRFVLVAKKDTQRERNSIIKWTKKN